MAIIQAFIDDSGSNDSGGNPVFVLAGYVSTADLWTQFSDEWEAECAAPPPVRKFKMSQANVFQGAFFGWGREDRDARLLRLASIIQKNTVLRIQTSIAWEDYHDVLQGKTPGLYDNPYVWLFYRLITSMSAWQAERGLCSKVDFIFDSQGKFGQQAVAWYESVRNVVLPEELARMGAAMHRDDDDVLPLKAADMWAWHVRRYLADGLATGTRPEPSVLMKTLAHCPAVGEPLLRSDLEDVLRAYRAGVEAAKSLNRDGEAR